MAMSRIQVKYGISVMIKSVWSCQATQELWLVDIVTFVANHCLQSPLKNTEKLNSTKMKTLTPWNGHLKGFLDPLNGPRGRP